MPCIVNPYCMDLCARFLTGFSIVGIFIVVESWLNDRANNRTRGTSIIYLYVRYFNRISNWNVLLLNFSNPEKYEPFILISVLLSMALIPILLAKRKASKI